jgi:predicted dehydrogenase
MQVALVGGEHVHTPHFVEILKHRKDIKVVGVWDYEADTARRRAKALGVPVIEDLNAIWNNPDIKAVIICSETDHHEALVIAAAKAHKAIYAEKPLGVGARDAYAMARAIDKAGVLFQTGYSMRSNPQVLFIKQQIEAGAFGKITRVVGSTTHNGALEHWFDTEWRWMADPKIAGVGGFGDLGTHSLDLLLWLTGDADRVTAALSDGTARYPNCDELGDGLLVFKNGALGTLTASWDDLTNPLTLEVSGTEAHAAIVRGDLYFRCPKIEGADGKHPWTKLPPALPSALELFLDAVEGKPNVPLVTADEAAYRSAVMEAMYQGAKGRKWIDTPREIEGR